MAVCEWCKREMTERVSCTVKTYLFGSGSYERFRVARGPGDREWEYLATGALP